MDKKISNDRTMILTKIYSSYIINSLQANNYEFLDHGTVLKKEFAATYPTTQPSIPLLNICCVTYKVDKRKTKTLPSE